MYFSKTLIKDRTKQIKAKLMDKIKVSAILKTTHTKEIKMAIKNKHIF